LIREGRVVNSFAADNRGRAKHCHVRTDTRTDDDLSAISAFVISDSEEAEEAVLSAIADQPVAQYFLTINVD
jgi:hypothetical protein